MELGQIENYADIRELVLMSVGTNKGSWIAFPTFGSDLFILRKIGKMNGKTCGTCRQMIVDSLQWLIEDGLAEKIACTTETEVNRINWQVTVFRPDGTSIFVEDSWNGT